MSLDKISLQMAGPSNRLIPTIKGGGGSSPSEIFRKSFGEPIPRIVDVKNNPLLVALFAPMGLVGRIQKKLTALSKKKGKIVPAKGMIASALSACEESGQENLVFVGVDFLSEYY